jgi:hypothetical protein
MRQTLSGPLISALLSLAVIYQPRARAASDLVINLATDAAVTTEIPISKGTYAVTIKNLAPRFFVAGASGTYRVSIAKEEHALPALPLPTATALSASTIPGALVKNAGDPCSAYKTAVEDFNAEKSTVKAQQLWNAMDRACADVHRIDLCLKLRDELVGAEDESAAATVLIQNHDLASTTCKNIVGMLVDGMTLPEGTYDLRENQSLVITIARGTDKTLRTWKYTYNAPASKGFRISYGFNFIPNGDHEYYSKAIPITSTPGSTSGPTYKLTEKNQTKSLDFAPSIFFSYPMGEPPWEFAIAAGLGFDFSAPVVFLGPSLIMNQNIQLVAGAVMQQQTRLRGEYTVDQQLNENLTNDQLTQKTYRLNAFVGLAFRFDSNPFAKSNTPAKVATPSPTPSPTPAPSPVKK